MPRPFLSGLRGRLLLLVFLAVLPAFALTWYTGAENRQRQREAVASDTVALARILANDQERVLEGTRQILSELSLVPEARGSDPQRLRPFFVILRKLYPGYSSFSLLDAAGNVQLAFPAPDRPTNFSDRPWFQRAITGRDFAVGDYQVGQLTGKRVIVAAWPVLDDAGGVVSVLAAGVDVTWLNQVAATAQLPPGAVLFLVDRHGVVLARYPEAAGVLGLGLGERALTSEMQRRAEGTLEVGDGDETSRVYAFTAVRGRVETGLRLAVGIPRARAYGEVERLQVRHLLALFMVMGLTLGAAWFAAERFVLRRVKSLLDATRRLAAGDPAARTRLPYGHGELSDLARAFDEMASAVQAREEERAEAEQELRRSEERFRAFMDNSPALAVIRTAAGEPVYANAAFERCYGLGPGEWRGQPLERFWDAETSRRFGEEDARVLASGMPRQSIEMATLADGRRRHWLTVTFPVASADGQRLAASMSLDLSEWREAQQALARAERRYTELVEHATDGIAIADASLRLTAVNGAACRQSGYTREELLQMRVPDLLDPADLADLPLRLGDLQSGRALVTERRFRRKDGSVLIAEVSAQLFEDGGVQAIVRDVTKRHEAEQALRESEERFRLLYQYLPLAYQSLSEHGTLVTVNDAWLALTGYRRGQVIGRRFSEFLAPGSAEVYESKFWRPIRSQDVHDVELTVVKGDHSTVTVLLDGRRGRDEHDDVRIHCALHDVTAARQASIRLRDSEVRYRTLFSESPVSLWEEDFSGIRRHLDRLRALGVTDFDEHFKANPEELADCIESVRVVDVNRATLALYGAETRSQLLAGLDRIIGDDGRDVFRHSIVALARGDRSWQSEGTNYTLNGDPIRLALQWSVAPGAERDWSRVLVSATDITQRTRAEDALRESEARFERVFRSSPSIMGISRRSDGVYLDVNDVFLRELGFRREEVIGRTATDLGLWISPANREEMIALLLEHGAFYHHDVRLRRRSGAVLEGTFSAVPLKAWGEDCLLVQVVDTTARHRAEEANRESQRMLRTLLTHLPGMVYQCCIDPEWTMLFVSEGCRELTGYEPGELVGNRVVSFGSLIAEDDRDRVSAAVRDAIAAGEPYRLSYRIRHASGRGSLGLGTGAGGPVVDARTADPRGFHLGHLGPEARRGGPPAQRRPAAAGAEDGSGWTARGRDRARLQQPAHRDPGLLGPGAQPPAAARPAGRSRGGDPSGGRAGGGPYAQAPRVQPQAGGRAARALAGLGARRDGADAAPADRRRHRAPSARRPRRQRQGRSDAGGAGGDEPRRQRAGRDAAWRDAHHRDRHARGGCARGGWPRRGERDLRGVQRHRHRRRNGRPDAGAALRTLLHHQAARPGHGARSVHGLRHRAPQRRLRGGGDAARGRIDVPGLPAPGGRAGRSGQRAAEHVRPLGGYRDGAHRGGRGVGAAADSRDARTPRLLRHRGP